MVSAAVSAKIEEIKASIAAESEQVKGAIADLKTQIADLKEQVANGADESELLTALDSLSASVDSIYTPDTVEAEPVPAVVEEV